MTMCAPKVPGPPPVREAPRAPDLTGGRTDAIARRRQTMSSMVLTDQLGMGMAATAGKPVLGA